MSFLKKNLGPAHKLFCKAWWENIAVKSSVVLNHIKSMKHPESREKLKERVARKLNTAEALQAHRCTEMQRDEQKGRNFTNRTSLQHEGCNDIHEGWNSSMRVGML